MSNKQQVNQAILTNRIKSALTHLVDDNQSAFVPGRAITDNILLTQELLKGYNCVNGPKRCSFKIDIQKAYDTIWIFQWWKRAKTRGFHIPLHIHIGYGNAKSYFEDEIRKEKEFKYHFGCKQLKITHLCFADDLIMLCHGDITSLNTLKKALDKFSALSGLYPNLGKCTMFCGSLDSDTKDEISNIFPFKEGKLPVRYLGVPLVTKKIGIANCKQLVDKVTQKLNDRKNTSLSYAGRAQLIASVLGSMQVYWGSVFLLPKAVVIDIEKLFKRFLWNSGESCKGKAKVAWKDVFKPKDQGGMGFKSLEVWNKTLLVKHLWNVASKKESLWVKWINVVKLKMRSVWDVAADSKDSWVWKNLLSLRDWVGKHMRYKVGNGKSINVWHDKWNDGDYLSKNISKKEIFYAGFNDQTKLADVMDSDGWKWPADWFVKYPWISNMKTPILNNCPDKAVWVDSNGIERRFSTNTVWKDVRSTSAKVSWHNLVWHPNCIPKHTFILWLAAKEKMYTQDKLSKWYPNKIFECSLCKKGMDSHDHLFFKCDYAKEIWKKICGKARMKFHNDSWNNTLDEMSKGVANRSVWGVIRKLCLAAVVYYIWQERNLRLFNNDQRDKEVLINTIIEEIKAKMVSITVKNTDTVLQAEEEWKLVTENHHDGAPGFKLCITEWRIESGCYNLLGDAQIDMSLEVQ
ncbi:RNA-directed DNA polymerase, eukaryota, reverse transcriptase zinc-binding domain protein, partial [Tanacetum coccineum]